MVTFAVSPFFLAPWRSLLDFAPTCFSTSKGFFRQTTEFVNKTDPVQSEGPRKPQFACFCSLIVGKVPSSYSMNLLTSAESCKLLGLQDAVWIIQGSMTIIKQEGACAIQENLCLQATTSTLQDLLPDSTPKDSLELLPLFLTAYLAW